MEKIAITESKSVIRSWVSDILVAFVASFCIGIAAPFTVHLPFSPVPITLQVQLVLFLAAMLGSRRGFLTVAFFLLQGGMGYPVFAGGACTFLHFLGPRGGYLVGYLIAAYFVGRMHENRDDKRPITLFKDMAVGNLIVYFFGALWLSQFVGVGRSILLGVLPFLLGDFLKLILFSRLANRYRSICKY